MQYGIKIQLRLGAHDFTARQWFDSESNRDTAIRRVRDASVNLPLRITKIRDAERYIGMENDVDTGALRRMGLLDQLYRSTGADVSTSDDDFQTIDLPGNVTLNIHIGA